MRELKNLKVEGLCGREGMVGSNNGRMLCGVQARGGLRRGENRKGFVDFGVGMSYEKLRGKEMCGL